MLTEPEPWYYYLAIPVLLLVLQLLVIVIASKISGKVTRMYKHLNKEGTDDATTK